MSQKQNYKGLTDAEVLESRKKNGVNILTPPEQDPWWKEFLDKFSDPLIIILLVAGVLSIGIAFYEFFGLGQNWKVFFEPIGIFVAIGLATTLAFIFEQRANKAFKILNQVNDDELVEVMRNGTMTTIPRKDVVVGDIVILNTGDEIPADGELLDAVTLSVDESTLTGEPLCVKTTDEEHFDKDATYPSNHAMRGTKVMEGHGVMRVLKVGDATEMGKVFEEAQIDDSVKTPLNEQLDGLADWITNVSYIFAGLIIVGQLIHFLGWGAWQAWMLIIPVALFFWLVIKKFEDWSKAKCIFTIISFFVIFFAMVIGAFSMLNPSTDSTTWSLLLAHTLKTLMVAVTLIVVAVPEGLPMAVTLSLAYSMSRMLKTNNLVRKMHACETMGATTVICTDKTGTLTQNQMQVYKADFFGDPSNEVLYEGIAVNSTAQLDLSGEKPQVLGNPTEGALLLWLKERDANYLDLRNGAMRLEELPFTTERKYMATVVKSATGKNILYVKGAPEIIFEMCNNTCGVTKKEIDAQLLEYQNQAMRTLGFAYQEIGDKDAIIADGKVVADKLTFLGIVAISDPVRVDVPDAVGEVIDAGIKVKIVTGDTPGTAKEIGRQIGLWNDTTDTERNIITGSEFAELSDKQLKERVRDLKIIARARPMDKKRLVEALQANNEVVLMYYRIGKGLIENSKYGNRFIDTLATDLKLDFPNMQGLSARNLRYMKRFAKEFEYDSILQHNVAKLPWTTITTIMDKIKDNDERIWYIEKTLENLWSRTVLEHQIATNLYERQALNDNKISNYKETLPIELGKRALEMLKDPYIFDIAYSENALEKDVENALVSNITNLLLEFR